MAEEKKPAAPKKKKAAPKKAADPCASLTNSKKLSTHLPKRPSEGDPCYWAWFEHARKLAQEEGVRLTPM